MSRVQSCTSMEAWPKSKPCKAQRVAVSKPDAVADVIAFLASDRARWITSASIPVDGGSKL
jgi:NAD(P)-dependent dehydrogenase (short-subunit alcohol dehydrogenase family)